VKVAFVSGIAYNILMIESEGVNVAFVSGIPSDSALAKGFSVELAVLC
jgi:hypothetical protein